jgi:hypothetical protein
MSDSNRTGPRRGRPGGAGNHNDDDRCGTCGAGCGIGFERGSGREPDRRR